MFDRVQNKSLELMGERLSCVFYGHGILFFITQHRKKNGSNKNVRNFNVATCGFMANFIKLKQDIKMPA